MISSLQNEKVKHIHALQTQVKARRKFGQIVIEGGRLVCDAVEQGHKLDYALHSESLAPGVLEFLANNRVNLLPVADNVMRHMSDTEQPQGVIAVMSQPLYTFPRYAQRVLILDAIADPGNLGTLLRSGAAAGVQVMLLGPGCVDLYSPKVMRSGMGAHFRIPMLEADWQTIAALCAANIVFLADMQQHDTDARYDQANWLQPWSLIIGSEANGASPEAEHMSQQRLYIPMTNETESLNAAVAGSVMLFEAQRQRLTKNES